MIGRSVLGLVLLAAAVPVLAAEPLTVREQWSPIRLQKAKIGLAVDKLADGRDVGSDARQIEDLLSRMADSTAALEEELDGVGTSATEQEVQFFGSSGGAPDGPFDLALLRGLVPGRRYEVSFSWTASTPPAPQGEARGYGNRGTVFPEPDPATQRVLVAGFTARTRSGTELLAFRRPDFVPDGYGLAQISFAPAAASVPEPAAWGLFLIGFAGLGVCFQRQRDRHIV